MDARVKPAHDAESEVRKLQHRHSFSVVVPSACTVLTRAGALPRGASRLASVQIVGFEPFAVPKRGKRSAEIRGRGTPHPLARLTIGPVPPAGGNCRPITRTGAPLGAPLRRFP